MLASMSFCRYTPVRITRCQQERVARSACVSFGIAVFIIKQLHEAEPFLKYIYFFGQSKNSSLFMERAVTLPYSQKPATCPCHESYQTGPHHRHRLSVVLILILSSNLRLGFLSGLCLSGFHTKLLHAPLLLSLRATCLDHLILLNYITRTPVLMLSVHYFNMHVQ